MSTWIQKSQRFANEAKGSVSILVAVSLPVLVLLAGGALDYARKNDMKVKLQSAVDGALLATLSYQKSHPDATTDELFERYSKELRQRVAPRLSSRGLTLKSKTLQKVGEGSFRTVVKASVDTNFLRLAAIDTLPLQVIAEAKSSRSRTEVALVLDVTGSMAGSKLRELKRAAKNFLDTIDDKIASNDPRDFRVALVPFSHYVNVGMQNRNASWMQVPQDRTVELRNWRGRVIRRKRIEWEGCAGSRNYPLNMKDESYGTKVPGVMNYARRKTASESSYYGYDYSWRGRNRCPDTPIMPLKSVKEEKDTLKQAIDSFRAGGWTYIPAGLMWGWRVLSPNEPYTEGADAQEVKQHNVRKVIVLMTDGANTRAPYRNSSIYYYKDHRSFYASYANRLTREACDNIKAINPATGRRNADIITITFNVRNPTIKQLMRDCATLGSYDVGSGQLVKVFEEIAGQLTDLHLSE